MLIGIKNLFNNERIAKVISSSIVIYINHPDSFAFNLSSIQSINHSLTPLISLFSCFAIYKQAKGKAKGKGKGKEEEEDEEEAEEEETSNNNNNNKSTSKMGEKGSK